MSELAFQGSDPFEPEPLAVLENIGLVNMTVVHGRWRLRASPPSNANLSIVWLAWPKCAGFVIEVLPGPTMVDGAAWVLLGPQEVDPKWGKLNLSGSALWIPGKGEISKLRVVFPFSLDGASEALQRKEAWNGAEAFSKRVEPLLAGDHGWVMAKPMRVTML